jgi:hypothetical protein
MIKKMFIDLFERPLEIFFEATCFLISILFLAFLFILMFIACAWFLAVMTPAHATAPATVTVIGIPASKRADCHQRRLFAESIAQARIQGHALELAQADAFVRAMDQGRSIGDACHVVHSVNSVWGIDGNVAGIGQAVYDDCMKGAM